MLTKVFASWLGFWRSELDSFFNFNPEEIRLTSTVGVEALRSVPTLVPPPFPPLGARRTWLNKMIVSNGLPVCLSKILPAGVPARAIHAIVGCGSSELGRPSSGISTNAPVANWLV